MDYSSSNRRKRIFIPKIDLPAILAIVFFAGLIFFYLIPGFEKIMMDRKRNLIHEMTSSAYSLLQHYHSLEISGTLDSLQARDQARSAISTIRYGTNNKDYFWITDLYPRMIVHPYRPDLNGTDLTEFRDSKGKKIFVEFVNQVSSSGESFVDYMWQWNDDSTRIVAKLSYVRLFKPWNWIIGTGIYVDDVRTEIRRMEFRALFISGTIGIIIIILLIAISRQSHKIENKRNRAEEELRKSKELYKTLAEAASEGVLIWSVSGIQANKTLLAWLGYTETDLPTLTIQQFFNSPCLPENDDPDAFYDELSARHSIECVLKTKNGNLIRSHADFSGILLGGVRAVLAVIRPAETFRSKPDFAPDSGLLKGINTGFFRITYGNKNRFLSATDPALRILGFNSVRELLPLTVDSLFANPVHFKAFRATLASKEDIINREVLLKRKGGEEFWAIINVTIIESDSHEIWCEGTIEEISASGFSENSLQVNLTEYSASVIMETPVSEIMQTPLKCQENLSAGNAALLMKENDSRVIIVSNSKGEPLGVIDSGTIGIRLAEGDFADTEIFRWMISPIAFISYRATLNQAFKMINDSPAKCLLVLNDQKNVAGIVTNDDLSKSFFTAPGLIIAGIEKSMSASALRVHYLSSRKLAISMIAGHADPYSVSLFISTIADVISKRALELCIGKAGKPPCRFAFIQTGSAGRKEQTLFTDQDNAIIFENTGESNLKNVREYFLLLGKNVNNMLAEAGFNLCKGGNMAGNARWCQPLDTWKKYFSDWIKIPGPNELLDVSIFFDFRHCYGDQSLTDELHDFVKNDLRTNDIFFHHMATAWMPFNPSMSQLSSGSTDLKKILMPLTGIIRLYSLKYGMNKFSTIDRVIELYSGKNIDHTMLRETIKAWKDISAIRLTRQASCINSGIEPDNIIDLNLVSGDLRFFAGEAITSVNNLMLKAGNDFHAGPG